MQDKGLCSPQNLPPHLPWLPAVPLPTWSPVLSYIQDQTVLFQGKESRQTKWPGRLKLHLAGNKVVFAKILPWFLHCQRLFLNFMCSGLLAFCLVCSHTLLGNFHTLHLSPARLWGLGGQTSSLGWMWLELRTQELLNSIPTGTLQALCRWKSALSPLWSTTTASPLERWFNPVVRGMTPESHSRPLMVSPWTWRLTSLCLCSLTLWGTYGKRACLTGLLWGESYTCKAQGICLALSKCSVNVNDHNPNSLHLLSTCSLFYVYQLV